MLKKIEINMIYLYALLIPCVTATRFYGFSFGRIFIFLLMLTSIIYGLGRRIKRINKTLLVMLMLYFFWMTCSLLWTPENCINQGAIRIGFAGILCLFYILICTMDFSEDEFSKIKDKLIWGGVISSIVLILFGGDYYGDEEEARYSLTSKTDPNFYSMYLLMPIALLYKKIITDKGKRKALDILNMLIMMSAILLCGSRGAMLSILVMLFLELIRGRRYGIVIGIVLGMYILFDNIGELYPRFEMNALVSGAGRSMIWAVIAEMIKDNFIFGVGVSGINGVYDDYAIQAGIGFLVGHGRDPHNAYMEILAELGIVGFSLYVGIVLYALYNNYKYKKNNEDMSVGVVGTLVAAMFLTSVLEEPIWFYLALLSSPSKVDGQN